MRKEKKNMKSNKIQSVKIQWAYCIDFHGQLYELILINFLWFLILKSQNIVHVSLSPLADSILNVWVRVETKL